MDSLCSLSCNKNRAITVDYPERHQSRHCKEKRLFAIALIVSSQKYRECKVNLGRNNAFYAAAARHFGS